MTLWNYSSLKQREKKLYSFAGTQISSTGISLEFLKIVAPFTAITTILGFIISAILGKQYMNPFYLDTFNLPYTLIAIGSGCGIGLALWYVRVSTYRLYEYLWAYLKPKKMYHNLNERSSEYAIYKCKIDGVIYSDLE